MATSIISPEKEGWLKKRGARMHRWSTRYFALIGPSLTYKLKQDSTSLRGTFDLVPGCILTEVEEDKGSKKGKKLYSFWIVWPEVGEKKTEKDEQDSDGDDDKDDQPTPKTKDLKQIVQSEVMNNRDKQRRAEEQLEKHHALDNNLSIGMKVAAVAVGGVVVGALTAGIGLVPYIAVVGAAAVASGGAVVYQYRRPSDSRLILAAETSQEASAWKSAIEEQILKLEATRKPMLPASADPDVISNILGTSSIGGGWIKVGQVEGVRIMQQLDFQNDRSFAEDVIMSLSGSKDNNTLPTGRLCRKTQVVVSSSPINTFLSLMDMTEPYWPSPSQGTIKLVEAVDDHVDIFGVCITLNDQNFPYFNKKVTLVGCLTRFWFLDDDGSYMITLSSTTHKDYPTDNDTKSIKGSKVLPLLMDAVLTVSPRKDQGLFDDDLIEAFVTCTIQINTKDNTWRQISEKLRSEFLNQFVLQLLDVKNRIYLSKYELNGEKFLSGGTKHISKPPTGSLSPNPFGTHSKKNIMRSQSGDLNSGVTTMQPVDNPKHLKRDTSDLTSKKNSQRRLSMSSSHGVISRSPEVNAEAYSLRNQLRAKEFELQRLQNANQGKSSSKQIIDLKDDIKKLQNQLDRLIGHHSDGSLVGRNDEVARARRFNEFVESTEIPSSNRIGNHIPCTPAARSVQSYHSTLLSSPKSPSEKQEEKKKTDDLLIPFPPHWVQKCNVGELAAWKELKYDLQDIAVLVFVFIISWVISMYFGKFKLTWFFSTQS